jgi:methyl-accepting chemotaxis protein
MKAMFAPAMALLRPLSNQVKLPFIACLFLLPTALSLLVERSPANQLVALGLYFLACYFMVGHYLQVQVMWGFLLGTLRAIGRGTLVETSGEGRVGGQFLMGHQSIQRVVSNLRGITGGAHASAQRIRLAANEIAVGNMNLSQRTEQQASTLEQIAAALEQLSATVKQNAGNCGTARTVADEANAVATRGQQMVTQVAQTMAGIEVSSRKVAHIIAVIEGIAFQTNILALNAAVEAANAGEAGRGFAVVAAEVRSLAQRSAEATKEIKGLIDAAMGSVDEGTRLVAETGRSMGGVVESVGEVTGRIRDIVAASEKQDVGVDQVGQAVAQLSDMTQQNAAAVEQVSASAIAFETEATRLEETVRGFAGAASVGQAQQVPATPAPDGPTPPRPTARPITRPTAAPIAPQFDEQWKEF